MSFDMYVPTRFIFGGGHSNELHQQNLPGKKAAVIISNGKSIRENGGLDRTLEQLKKANVQAAVFIQWNWCESIEKRGYGLCGNLQ